MTHRSLSLEQVDPDVGGKIQPHLAALPHNRWRVMTPWMLWGGGAGLLSWVTSALITYENPGSFLGMIVGFLIFALVMGVGVQGCRTTQKQVERRLTSADLRAVSRVAGLSRAESAYVDALASLADAASLLGESLMGDLLAQLNDLAANARVLEAQHGQLATALGPSSLGELEGEYAALVERRETASDEASRRAIEQSIALCDGRLAQVRGIAPGLSRIEAQQEVVYQTLASVESSLRRMSASPAEPPSLQVEEIRRVTTEAVLQTRAVEEAVQEVLTVGAR